jgi:hypothetical protein
MCQKCFCVIQLRRNCSVCLCYKGMYAYLFTQVYKKYVFRVPSVMQNSKYLKINRNVLESVIVTFMY